MQGLTSWKAWCLLPVGGPLASKGFMRVGQGKEDTEQKDWRNGALEEGTFSLVIQLKMKASFSTFTLGISLLFLLIIATEDFPSVGKIRYTTKKKRELSYCSILAQNDSKRDFTNSQGFRIPIVSVRLSFDVSMSERGVAILNEVHRSKAFWIFSVIVFFFLTMLWAPLSSLNKPLSEPWLIYHYLARPGQST